MLRQPHSDATRPFKAHRIGREGGNVAAVDYDMGRNGYAYFDTDAANYHVSTGGERSLWNHGRRYRNDGVDIEFDQAGKAYYVSKLEATEWLQYTLTAEAEGRYLLKLLVASVAEGGRIAVAVNHGEARALDVPDTGGDLRWAAVELPDVDLEQGNNVVILRVERGGYHLSAMQFVRSDAVEIHR